MDKHMERRYEMPAPMNAAVKDGAWLTAVNAVTMNAAAVTPRDEYLFGGGTHYEIYEKLGAHPVISENGGGVHFAVWAPNAKSVSVVGDFNEWQREVHVMHRLNNSGIYELYIEGVRPGAMYKYAIETQDGGVLFKADPYGNFCQVRPDNASIVTALNGFEWKDDLWLKNRQKIQANDQPMAIYEVHIGSWKKDETGANFGFKNYKDIAHELADYVKHMGYTHVELMGIAEHSYDGSWGYQVTGYYAPTSRYGTPEDFMYMVDYLHCQGIGVILDWVPAHFSKDAHGLGRFDGEPLYEYADRRKGEIPQWGTWVFDYGKPQVTNFLIANALFWLEKFHIDGLRVDAVAFMLYVDYGKDYGQRVSDGNGDNINVEAVAFLKQLNTVIAQRNPGCLMIAEESTVWPKVSGPVDEGGLGFAYKWNMGWMNDFLSYMHVEYHRRSEHHHKLTFSFTYAFSENYVLSLSHDEVVHLKCSMLNKMPGDIREKFGHLRTAYGLMMAHPGKKLLFMGQDFAQLREWSETRSLDWDLPENDMKHRQMQDYVRDLLTFYKTHPALYATDCVADGFQWVYGDDRAHNMLTICRMTKDRSQCILFHFNFSPLVYRNHRIGCLCPGTYKEIFNSDAKKYGGSDVLNLQPVAAQKISWDWKDYSLQVNVPAYGMIALAFEYIEEKA